MEDDYKDDTDYSEYESVGHRKWREQKQFNHLFVGIMIGVAVSVIIGSGILR